MIVEYIMIAWARVLSWYVYMHIILTWGHAVPKDKLECRYIKWSTSAHVCYNYSHYFYYMLLFKVAKNKGILSLNNIVFA